MQRQVEQSRIIAGDRKHLEAARERRRGARRQIQNADTRSATSALVSDKNTMATGCSSPSDTSCTSNRTSRARSAAHAQRETRSMAKSAVRRPIGFHSKKRERYIDGIFRSSHASFFRLQGIPWKTLSSWMKSTRD
jgi:hypothetical protein